MVQIKKSITVYKIIMKKIGSCAIIEYISFGGWRVWLKTKNMCATMLA